MAGSFNIDDYGESYIFLSARNPSTPPHILEDIWVQRDNPKVNSRVLWELARNPSTPPHILEDIWAQRNNPKVDSRVLCELAGNPNTPSHILEDIWVQRNQENVTNEVLNGLAGNPTTPPHILKDIWVQRDNPKVDSRILWELVRNPSTPLHILEDIWAQRNNPKVNSAVLWELAGNPTTPPHILEDIWAQRDNPKVISRVLCELAGNPNTPIKTVLFCMAIVPGVDIASLSNREGDFATFAQRMCELVEREILAGKEAELLGAIKGYEATAQSLLPDDRRTLLNMFLEKFITGKIKLEEITDKLSAIEVKAKIRLEGLASTSSYSAISPQVSRTTLSEILHEFGIEAIPGQTAKTTGQVVGGAIKALEDTTAVEEAPGKTYDGEIGVGFAFHFSSFLTARRGSSSTVRTGHNQ